MSNSLFSPYSQDENRVTSSILAVFERISFALVEYILQALCQETETNLLVFRNQPSGIESVPDAVVRASFAYWIETKIVPQSVDKAQILAHLKNLDAQTQLARQRLLVLTPDTAMPKPLKEIEDERIAWANFDALQQILLQLLNPDIDWLTSNRPVPTEREQELLRELLRFLMLRKLVGLEDQAVVVAARIALPEYLKYSVYMCQPNRAFQPCTHLGFYAEGQIYRSIPQIIDQVESVILTKQAVELRSDLPQETRLRLQTLVEVLDRDWKDYRRREEAKVIFLSPPDSTMTLHLPQDIRNDLMSETGRPIAFTQGQRYVPLSKLKKHPRFTSQLVE